MGNSENGKVKNENLQEESLESTLEKINELNEKINNSNDSKEKKALQKELDNIITLHEKHKQNKQNEQFNKGLNLTNERNVQSSQSNTTASFSHKELDNMQGEVSNQVNNDNQKKSNKMTFDEILSELDALIGENNATTSNQNAIPRQENIASISRQRSNNTHGEVSGQPNTDNTVNFNNMVKDREYELSKNSLPERSTSLYHSKLIRTKSEITSKRKQLETILSKIGDEDKKTEIIEQIKNIKVIESKYKKAINDFAKEKWPTSDVDDFITNHNNAINKIQNKVINLANEDLRNDINNLSEKIDNNFFNQSNNAVDLVDLYETKKELTALLIDIDDPEKNFLGNYIDYKNTFNGIKDNYSKNFEHSEPTTSDAIERSNLEVSNNLQNANESPSVFNTFGQEQEFVINPKLERIDNIDQLNINDSNHYNKGASYQDYTKNNNASNSFRLPTNASTAPHAIKGDTNISWPIIPKKIPADSINRNRQERKNILDTYNTLDKLRQYNFRNLTKTNNDASQKSRTSQNFQQSPVNKLY